MLALSRVVDARPLPRRILDPDTIVAGPTPVPSARCPRRGRIARDRLLHRGTDQRWIKATVAAIYENRCDLPDRRQRFGNLPMLAGRRLEPYTLETITPRVGLDTSRCDQLIDGRLTGPTIQQEKIGPAGMRPISDVQCPHKGVGVFAPGRRVELPDLRQRAAELGVAISMRTAQDDRNRCAGLAPAEWFKLNKVAHLPAYGMSVFEVPNATSEIRAGVRLRAPDWTGGEGANAAVNWPHRVPGATLPEASATLP